MLGRSKEIYKSGTVEDYPIKQLPEAEIDEKISAIIAETGASGMRVIDKVMGRAAS